MTLLIKLPGVLTDTTGMSRLITTLRGFPDADLTDLFLFEDGSGTAPANTVSGGGVGTIEAPVASNNAYSWLSGGGGLSLSGSQIMTAPASDASGAWTLVLGSAMVASVGGTASERIAGVMGMRQFTASPVRGCSLYMRGGTDWNSGSPTPYYQGRPANAGAQGTLASLTPTSGLSEIGKRRLSVLSYDGTSTITAKIYAADGSIVAQGTMATSDAEMFTASSVTLTSLNPTVGMSSATYAGGQQYVEAFARYSKVLDSTEIDVVLAACKALGSARGRAWT